jgi:hypothetical protein
LHSLWLSSHTPSIPAIQLYSRCAVWLPIALTCRICHSTRYRDTYRTPLCHSLFAITPLFLDALHRSHQCHALSMPTDSLLHTCTITAVWLPITWTCRIHYRTRYRDPYRTPLYHYLLTTTPIFFEAQHRTHHCHTIATPTDSLPHTGTITATPELLPHNARL